jgi:hypothetical protein
MRRTVAILLVAATALLMAVPVGASDGPTTGPAALPAAPAVVEAPAMPAAPPVVEAPVPPAAPAAVEAPAAPTARPAVKSVRAKAPTRADVTDAAYAARLQADLCLARQIFCGLDHSGRYPAR